MYNFPSSGCNSAVQQEVEGEYATATAGDAITCLLGSLSQVYGAVMNINRGNPFQKEVVLDSWPDFKAVITRRQKEVQF